MIKLPLHFIYKCGAAGPEQFFITRGPLWAAASPFFAEGSKVYLVYDLVCTVDYALR